MGIFSALLLALIALVGDFLPLRKTILMSVVGVYTVVEGGVDISINVFLDMQ
jgi:hypothetical protein